MEFFDVLYARHSVRGYTDRPLPQGCIEELLRAAACAPSAHNAQPWHFTALVSQTSKELLMAHTAPAFRRMLANSGLSASQIEARLAQSKEYFTKVPALVIASMVPMEREDPRGVERILALQSVSAAVTQLLLAAQAMGLGACWYSLPLRCPDEVRRAIQGHPGWEPAALITIGYENAKIIKKEKRPLDEQYTVL